MRKLKVMQVGITLFGVFGLQFVNSKQKVCTADKSPCQIPFVFKGQTYFECTTEAPGGEEDLFGRCPILLENSKTREAGDNPDNWKKCDSDTCPLQKYTSNHDIETHLGDLASIYPKLAEQVTVGQSTLGQNISGIRISTKVKRSERDLLKPMVRYVGNMHGNEPVGREMLNHFASVLLQGYGIVDEITELVDNTDITIIPTMNPDGFDRGTEGACSGADYKTGRYNEGNIDLNRNFPTWADVNKTVEELYEGREPETRAMMDLILSQPWVLSANFHDGAVVASYPWDDYQGHKRTTGYSTTPDHDLFQHLASTYSSNHQTMLDHNVCQRWFFFDGITNGADWYPLYGGMQDFNYIYSNDMEITMELSCCKYPKKYYLNKEWERNKVSLIKYLQQVHSGVKGMVMTTSLSNGETPLSNAVITVEDSTGVEIEKNVTSSSRGEFWRLLLPGDYTIRGYYDMCDLAGFSLTSSPVPVTITKEEPLVRLDLSLDNVLSNCPGPR